MTTDLYTLISADVDLKKAAGTHGGEYMGACPFCRAGVDRFRVWPNADRPSWWCRHCGKRGDAIQYLREQGHSYREACRLLGVDVADAPRHASPIIAPPAACEPPAEDWRRAAGAFVAWAQAQLMSTPSAMDYLTHRGLSQATIGRALLGYNPAARECSRAKWGMLPEAGRDTFWLPAGIVIPCCVAGVLWKVQIRREVVGEGQDRYKTVTGSGNALYGADSCAPGKPAMLVEGPFDSLAVQQTAGDLIGAAACGTSGARRVKWLSMLALCSEVLISLDADDAGDTASRYWLDALDGSRRWRPMYADPAQMMEDQQDVRGWVLSGLRREALVLGGIPLEYWREEVRLGCAASLDRLRAICAERGADYDATIEELKR